MVNVSLNLFLFGDINDRDDKQYIVFEPCSGKCLGDGSGSGSGLFLFV